MLIGYNLCSIAEKSVYVNMDKTGVYPYNKLKIAISLSSLGLLLFGVSHWMFAFKYFSMSRQTPYKLTKKQVPRSLVVCDKVTNWVFFSLNCLAPTRIWIGYVVYYTAKQNSHLTVSSKFH
jgi:hypothetical protein